ncbi:MAG TPA: glycoside hydrolase family 36 protein [Opitutus sp.]|nr:glycoside hydrolase family 36 protein [Opitutus sp.]
MPSPHSSNALFPRREFLRRASLLGATAVVAPSWLDANSSGPAPAVELKNDHFAVSFDRRTGTIDVRRASGAPLLSGGSARANTLAGIHALAAPGRDYDADTAGFRDALGAGRRMTILAKDPDRRLDLRAEITLYDGRPLVAFEVFATNVSSRDVMLHSLEPIRVVAEEGGTLRLPGVAKCLTNGEMYYDAGTLHQFTDATQPGLVRPVTRAQLANASVAADRPTMPSWWNTGFFSGYDQEGLVLGYLENTQALGLILTARTAPGQISFLAESVFSPAVTLRPGRSVGSNRFQLNLAPDPYAALEAYADAVGAAQGARHSRPVNGWCSWFYTLANVSEDEVLRNTEFAARHLRPFGLDWIQIDEGYQRSHGDWEGNERFPHGMGWLAEQIRAHGFKAGLWISPYVIDEPAPLFREHPEWLLHHADGTLQQVGNWDDENSEAARNEKPKRYGLDITHPGAAAWLRDLFTTITHRWGCEMIKIDFVAWSILAAKHFHDPTRSTAEVYRQGMRIMREAAGEACHILECGPGATTVGLIDSMRIEADINYGYADAAWKTYFQDPACSAAAAGKRYYFHGRTWVNDADHICMDLLTNAEAQAAATIIAMSGGNMISGDRLADLDPAKLDILRRITPSSGAAAIPVDLFDADIPTAFVLPIKRPFASWSVFACFNPDRTQPLSRRFPLHRLRLDPAKTWLAFDFWKQRFVGEVTNELAVTMDPGGVTLLALHEATGSPQALSTDRHVTQGAIELEDVKWDPAKQMLSGVSLGPRQSSHNVFVHVPGEHPWTWGGYVLFRDRERYDLKLVDEHILRVHVRFEDADRVPWEINVGEYFG